MKTLTELNQDICNQFKVAYKKIKEDEKELQNSDIPNKEIHSSLIDEYKATIFSKITMWVWFLAKEKGIDPKVLNQHAKFVSKTEQA